MQQKRIVTTLKPTKTIDNSDSHTGSKRRVAAYARVSTSHPEQQESYQSQCEYFTKMIQSRPDWKFCGIFADEGVSGTSIKKRDSFNEMIADALSGKIDLIVTKSISRFARNTVDTLSIIRKLKACGVEVFFEKEGVYTLDSKGELFITILSSVAQKESRNLSENTAWGIRKRFSDGQLFGFPYGRFLGYKKGKDGFPAIVEDQAIVARYIYASFLQKNSPTEIAKRLTALGIPTPGGKTVWQVNVVKSILTNEKYMGDALLQKTFCEDFLTKKYRRNTGELAQYYVENSHESIIPKPIFKYVQMDIKNRRPRVERRWIYIICGQCGNSYHRIVHHSNDDRYRQYVWICNNRFSKDFPCSNTTLISDLDLENLTQALVLKLLAAYPEVQNICRKAVSKAVRSASKREKALCSLDASLQGMYRFSLEKVWRGIINSAVVNSPTEVGFKLVNETQCTLTFTHHRSKAK